MYLTSPGRPTDVGLQMGKGLLSLQQLKVEGDVLFLLYFFWFFLLSFIFPFSPVPLFHPRKKMIVLTDPQVWDHACQKILKDTDLYDILEF